MTANCRCAERRDPALRHPGLSLDEPPRRAPAGAARQPAAAARFQTKTAQIVPSASIAGNALTVVIAIMSFLACLTAGAVYMVNQSANAWVNDIASEITVELDPINTADIEKKMTLVVAVPRQAEGHHPGQAAHRRRQRQAARAVARPEQRARGAAHPAPDRGRDRPLQSARHPADQGRRSRRISRASRSTTTAAGRPRSRR